MEKKNWNGSRWGFALAAACCWAMGIGWIPLHLESLDGLDVMVALVWLINAAVWTFRAVRRRK